MKIFEEMKAVLEMQAPIGQKAASVKPFLISSHTLHISIQQNIEHTEPAHFQVDDKVLYRSPIIKSPTNYSWAWRHGTVQEVIQDLDLVIIKPFETLETWIGIPFVYVRGYEKNEIYELMEEEESEWEG